MAQHEQTADQTSGSTSVPRPQESRASCGIRVKTGLRAGYEVTREYSTSYTNSSSVSRSYHID